MNNICVRALQYIWVYILMFIMESILDIFIQNSLSSLARDFFKKEALLDKYHYVIAREMRKSKLINMNIKEFWQYNIQFCKKIMN